MINIFLKNNMKIVSIFLKLIIRAWDPDFSKATSEEREKMKTSEKEFQEGIYFTDEEVWK